jgi:hypothetical protein
MGRGIILGRGPERFGPKQCTNEKAVHLGEPQRICVVCSWAPRAYSLWLAFLSLAGLFRADFEPNPQS